MRSFVRRQGRITLSQRAALASYWEQFGLELKLYDWSSVFGRETRPYLEIGFGRGDVLLTLAERHPEHDFVGVEVYEPGIGRLLGELAARRITNVRVIREDVVEVLEQSIAEASLAGLLIFFPDPWPKKRHHKRRLIQSEFVALAGPKLCEGGVLELATDWEPYAWQMLEVVEGHGQFRNLAGEGQFSTDRSTRPITKFERRGTALGHGVWDLRFARVSGPRD